MEYSGRRGSVTMKGIVLGERYQEKDAYDIYAVISRYKENPREVAKILKNSLKEPLVNDAIQSIRVAFATRKSNGPQWVADFMQPASLEERERILTDAFMTVQEFIAQLFNPTH
jgi:hypothetical protein